MENASKALLIAGGILIAILTVTALVVMFNKIGIFYSTENNSASEEEIAKFNLEYEAYNRDDVRGTELFTLLNKVANYNDRKSNIGEEGASIGYDPIEVIINIGKENLILFTADGESPNLITKSEYKEKTKKSTFRDELKNELDNIVSTYGETSLENLSKALTKIFIESNDGNEQDKAVNNFNNISKKVKVKNFNELQTKKDDIYKYYEYVQFKRAHFKCTKTDYKNGRIVKMTFEFKGKFE